MELTALPESRAAPPRAWDRAKADVEKFNDNRPDINLDNFSTAQLQQLLDWASQVNTKFQTVLDNSQQDSQNEWLAKEQVLDELFKASLDDPKDIL